MASLATSYTMMRPEQQVAISDPYPQLAQEIPTDYIFPNEVLQSSTVSLDSTQQFSPNDHISPTDANFIDPSIVQTDPAFIADFTQAIPSFSIPTTMEMESRTSLTPPLPPPTPVVVQNATSAYTSSLQSALGEPVSLSTPSIRQTDVLSFMSVDTEQPRSKLENTLSAAKATDTTLKNLIELCTIARNALKTNQWAQARSRLIEVVAIAPQLQDCIQEMVALDTTGHTKRCASPTALPRPIKALKSEPQELNLDINGYFPSLPPSSAPPSRSASPFRYSQAQPVFPNGYAGISPSSTDESVYMSPPAFPPIRGWSDPTISRHTHSLSAGSIHTATTVQQNARTGPLGRMNRSGSVNSGFGGMPFTYPKTYSSDVWSSKSAGILPAQSDVQLSPPPALAVSGISSAPVWRNPRIETHWPEEAESTDEDDDDGDDDHGRPIIDHFDNPGPSARQSPDNHSSSASNPDVPMEYRQQVEQILLMFLRRICSNLDATDSKGEPIHQTLMAKKMQRLDESKDFRPFKFRIQAFTNAFLEELARQGYTEDKIPMKKVRNFLWRCPYIMRYNEDGKKSKSKGNYIWNIDAKKVPDSWEFRPIYRKVAGTPPVATCGQSWVFTPHIWDPRADFKNVSVHFSSPALPTWLSWDGDSLVGTAPPDTPSCEVDIIAKYVLDGQEGQLNRKLQIITAPNPQQAYARVQPPELSRTVSDPLIFQQAGTMLSKRTPYRVVAPVSVPDVLDVPAFVSPPAAAEAVVNVLQNVKQRVVEESQRVAAEETHGQLPSAANTEEELEHLFTQKLVLDSSLHAVGESMHGRQTLIADAAQGVVMFAAQKVVSPQLQAQSPTVAVTHASVRMMSDYTQGAIAQAVDIAYQQEPPRNNDVEAMIMQAHHILKLSGPGSAPPSVMIPTRCLPPSNPYTTLLPQYT